MGGGSSSCTADLCWSQGHPPVGKNVGEEGWAQQMGWWSQGTGGDLWPPGQLQDLCSVCAGNAARCSRDETKTLRSVSEAAVCLLKTRFMFRRHSFTLCAVSVVHESKRSARSADGATFDFCNFQNFLSVVVLFTNIFPMFDSFSC